jgi:hypothetical protein
LSQGPGAASDRSFGAFMLSSSLPLAERADEPSSLGAVEHDRRCLVVLEGAEPEERGWSSATDVRAVLVCVHDEHWAELRGERGERASCPLGLFERARVVTKEDVDLAATREALQCGPLARDGTMPVATGPTRSDGKRASVGETAQPTQPEPCPCRQVVHAETERHRADSGASGAGACERISVVVVSVHEEKLEAGPAKQRTDGAEEATPFRVARQVAEVAQGEECVAALLDGAFDQVAQVTAIAVQVAEGEQPAHSSRAYRARSDHRTWLSAGAGRKRLSDGEHISARASAEEGC